jgi:hypothetical protein
MLSTSNKTKFQYQYLLIAVLILALVSAIALFQFGNLPTIFVGQPATQNLTTLSPAEVSTYRWEAMAEFYAKQAAAANLSWPSRPDFSILNAQAMIPVTGSAEGSAIYHQSEWTAPVAVQNSLAQYYLSERAAFGVAQNGMDIYHQSERNAAQVQGTSFHLGREADAARYTAVAEFFAAKEAASIQRGRDADAARYTVMAKLYAAQSESIQYGPPGR